MNIQLIDKIKRLHSVLLSDNRDLIEFTGGWQCVYCQTAGDSLDDLDWNNDTAICKHCGIDSVSPMVSSVYTKLADIYFTPYSGLGHGRIRVTPEPESDR